jgi:putative ABC transport system substrate-binding protein
MKRREFITLVGGAAAWPLAARAQQSAMPVVGFLTSRASGDDPYLLDAFRLGLKESGYVEGQNVAIEYRFADGHYDRLPALALDLVQRQVVVIAANGFAAETAKSATTTIPIVFVAGFDPVERGLVASLSRPGGNVTGVSVLDVQLGPKRLELLHDLVPKASVVAVLVNPTDPARAKAISRAVQTAAESLGLQVKVLEASSVRDFDKVFASLPDMRVGGLVVVGDPFFNSHGQLLGALAARHSVPTIFQFHEFAAGGGLLSYGTSLTDAFHQIGQYAGRIVKGEKPADLPVQQATKVELIINLKAAIALGIAIPLPLFGRADEVIE